MEKKDFSHLKYYPGEDGNPFDVILKKSQNIENINFFLFGAILLALASLPFLFAQRKYIVVLWGFFLLDWILLSLLPIAKKSFGPAKPPTLLLALMRTFFALLPLTIPIKFILQTIGTLLVIYTFWIEPHSIKTTYQKLPTNKISIGNHFKIIHLGDLHIERITKREKQIQDILNKEKPDLILFSGDILNLSNVTDPIAIEEAKTIINNWKAEYDIFFVSGSSAVDLKEIFPKIMEDLPSVKWLNNQKETIAINKDSIDIYGINCSHRPHIDSPILNKLMLNTQKQRFSILLYHSPDIAPQAAQYGIDLQLSGHTHGGQVRLPIYGALITASLYGKKFESGLCKIDQLTLYVTNGIGLEGGGAPRVRFLCPPEVIIWDIIGTGNQSNE